MSEPRLIFTGNVIVDLVMTIGRLPDPGGDTIASSSTITAGGGYNTMVAAARDGLPVVFAGQFGTGPFGRIVRDALANGGFETVQAGLPEVDSGYCVALVDASTERTFVTTVGAEGRLTRADLDRVPVSPQDVVYVSGYSLAHPENAKALPGWLGDLPPEVRVITDPSPLIGELDPQTLATVLARTDVLSLNRREATIATRLDDLAGAAGRLLEAVRAPGLVVVRDGPAGCWVADGRSESVHVPGFPVDAVDTNGAGDAHGGVLAAALARGDEPIAAAKRANAASAIAVTRRGPATAPTTAEIDDLLRSIDDTVPAAP